MTRYSVSVLDCFFRFIVWSDFCDSELLTSHTVDTRSHPLLRFLFVLALLLPILNSVFRVCQTRIPVVHLVRNCGRRRSDLHSSPHPGSGKQNDLFAEYKPSQWVMRPAEPDRFVMDSRRTEDSQNLTGLATMVKFLKSKIQRKKKRKQKPK